MKKSTIFLLGAAGIGAYLIYRNQQSKKAKGYKAPPGTTTQQQQKIIQSAFANLLPRKKKLIPKIIVQPVQSITKQQYDAAKKSILSKAGTIIKKVLAAKKGVSGVDCVDGLY